VDSPLFNCLASLSKLNGRPLLACTVPNTLGSCPRGTLLPSPCCNCPETHKGSVQVSFCSINFHISHIAADYTSQFCWDYICGVMAEVDMFKKFDFLFSVMSYLNGVL
jgi:hypothetical protein